MKNIDDMIKVAKEVINNAYSPYSKIRIAAVVRGKSGKLYYGVNIENASYGLTICAERVAIFNAVAQGERKFETILIYSPDVMPWPCGACRQVMSEFFSPETKVVIVGKEHMKELIFRELWPPEYSFSKNQLRRNIYR
ncbi:MAG: cytidine deaminase [Candidatus Njordarchaeales archaeon]